MYAVAGSVLPRLQMGTAARFQLSPGRQNRPSGADGLTSWLFQPVVGRRSPAWRITSGWPGYTQFRHFGSGGGSQRRIGRELGVYRETVARYVWLADAGSRASPEPGPSSDLNRPNLPLGPDGQNRPNLPAGSGPASQAESYRDAIIAGLEQGLSAQRIWQDLHRDHSFPGSYDCGKRFARRLRARTMLPFRRMESPAGQESPVDFGTGAPVITADIRLQEAVGHALNHAEFLELILQEEFAVRDDRKAVARYIRTGQVLERARRKYASTTD